MLSSMRSIITEHDDSLHKAWLRFLPYREPSTKNQSVPSATDRVIDWGQIILHGFRRSLSCRFRKAGIEKHRTRPMTGNHRCFLDDVYDGLVHDRFELFWDFDGFVSLYFSQCFPNVSRQFTTFHDNAQRWWCPWTEPLINCKSYQTDFCEL